MDKWKTVLEAERLRLLPASEVYSYLSSLEPAAWLSSNLTDEAFDGLAGRNDPLIDLALSRFAGNHGKLRTLFDKGGMLRTAVLANRSAFGLMIQVVTGDEIEEIARSGSNDELSAALQNPSIDAGKLAAIVSNRMTPPMPIERWQLVVMVAAVNPVLSKRFDIFELFSNYEGRKAHRHLLSAFWDLLWAVDPTKEWAYVLSTSLPTVDYEMTRRPEFEPKTEEAGFSIEDVGKRNNAILAALSQRWATPEDHASKYVDSWADVRSALAERLVQGDRFSANENLARDHPDQSIRIGFYKGCIITPEFDVEAAHGKDGDTFVVAIVENKTLYERKNGVVQEAVRNLTYKVDMGVDWVAGRFRNYKDQYGKENPAHYGDWPIEAPEVAEEPVQSETNAPQIGTITKAFWFVLGALIALMWRYR